jgi:hypothetical protein
MSNNPLPPAPVAGGHNWSCETLQVPRRTTFNDILTPPATPVRQSLLPLYSEPQERPSWFWCCPRMFLSCVLGIVAFSVAIVLIGYMIYAIATRPKTTEILPGGREVGFISTAGYWIQNRMRGLLLGIMWRSEWVSVFDMRGLRRRGFRSVNGLMIRIFE